MKTLIILRWTCLILMLIAVIYGTIRVLRHKERQYDKNTAIAYIIAVFFAICISILTDIENKMAKETVIESPKDTTESNVSDTDLILDKIKDIGKQSIEAIKEYIPQEFIEQGEETAPETPN